MVLAARGNDGAHERLRQRARQIIGLALLFTGRSQHRDRQGLDALRYKWHHTHALTNVWQLAPLHGVERIKGTMRRAAPRVHNPSSLSAAHLNQKPLAFMRRILNAATDPGDAVWEPFGGLASASVAAVETGRFACVAEIDHDFAEIAAQRLDDAVAGRDPEADVMA